MLKSAIGLLLGSAFAGMVPRVWHMAQGALPPAAAPDAVASEGTPPGRRGGGREILAGTAPMRGEVPSALGVGLLQGIILRDAAAAAPAREPVRRVYVERAGGAIRSEDLPRVARASPTRGGLPAGARPGARGGSQQPRRGAGTRGPAGSPRGRDRTGCSSASAGRSDVMGPRERPSRTRGRGHGVGPGGTGAIHAPHSPVVGRRLAPAPGPVGPAPPAPPATPNGVGTAELSPVRRPGLRERGDVGDLRREVPTARPRVAGAS